jgi:hypothetical protein
VHDAEARLQLTFAKLYDRGMQRVEEPLGLPLEGLQFVFLQGLDHIQVRIEHHVLPCGSEGVADDPALAGHGDAARGFVHDADRGAGMGLGVGVDGIVQGLFKVISQGLDLFQSVCCVRMISGMVAGMVGVWSGYV